MKYLNLSLAQVRKLGARIGKKTAKKGSIIGLSGDLGSGKTTFAKALAMSLGIKSLKSPTFIVSQRYPLKENFLYHIDFYRLDHPKQLLSLGLNETFSSNNIVLIEWVDKFPQIMKKCDILINFLVKPNNKRDVIIKIPNAK
ncbi:MAG TPA: tRNA (adenosine(37)-N6)-threonylcarbamoyltransferase complex ATPase subunit type 1 TsaE [Patescibacteria group bacterium]